MDTFGISLLREKFSIFDLKRGHAPPIIALSNRIACTYQDMNGGRETFVVRAQNMHSCLRMAGHITQAALTNPMFTLKPASFGWQRSWNSVKNQFERNYNPALWGAVYHKGKVLFSEGERHVFIDMIEKFDFENDKEYDTSPVLAEAALNQKGKSVRIEFNSSVACVVTWEDNEANIGVILRDAQRATTFSFKVSEISPEKPVQLPQCFQAAAAFLEGIQLCFFIGSAYAKAQRGLIQKRTAEHKKMTDAAARLNRLKNEILALENAYRVRYRPEKPDFDALTLNAQDIHGRTLDDLIARGEIKIITINTDKDAYDEPESEGTDLDEDLDEGLTAPEE